MNEVRTIKLSNRRRRKRGGRGGRGRGIIIIITHHCAVFLSNNGLRIRIGW